MTLRVCQDAALVVGWIFFFVTAFPARGSTFPSCFLNLYIQYACYQIPGTRYVLRTPLFFQHTPVNVANPTTISCVLSQALLQKKNVCSPPSASARGRFWISSRFPFAVHRTGVRLIGVTAYLGSFLSESVFFRHFQSLEIIRDMYRYTEAFCHYSCNSCNPPEATKNQVP